MKHFFFFAFLVVGLGACHSSQVVTGIGFKDYAVTTSLKSDSSVLGMLKNYRDSVDKNMDEVFAVSQDELLKELPNSTLGNFLADAYLWAATKHINRPVDVAFMNHGGIRINRIAAGKVTRRTIFEVMPFDNALVIIEIKGSLLKTYLDFLAADGGGGGVSGLSYQIKDKKAVNVLVGGLSLDPNKSYIMANSDYAVDGGGGFTGFKTLHQNRTNYLQRDAIIDYCKMHKAAGKNLVVEQPKRITK
ncbi:MAG: 5'-nucleotidase C-terminal domain-containing protein [Chitinophagaceae bacterium]